MSNLVVQTTQSVKKMLESNSEVIAKAMPRGSNYDRFQRVILHQIATNPQIAECSPVSVFMSASKVATTGLEPGEQIHIIAYYNSKTRSKEAKVQYDYKGLIELCLRSGKVKHLYASEVCQNDEFSVSRGTDVSILHKPNPFADRGNVIGYYAVAFFTDGSTDFETMTTNEIAEIRGRAKTDFIWKANLGEMSKKTVLKRLMKRLPKSVEAVDAIKDDHALAMGEEINVTPNIEGLQYDETNPNQAKESVQAERLKQLKEEVLEGLKPSEMEEPPSDYQQ